MRNTTLNNIRPVCERHSGLGAQVSVFWWLCPCAGVVGTVDTQDHLQTLRTTADTGASPHSGERIKPEGERKVQFSCANYYNNYMNYLPLIHNYCGAE